MASPMLAPAKVHYPSSDGRPMAESDFQRTPLTYAVDRLRFHFRDRRDVYVSGNLLLYYQEGNPRAVVAPDVFVVLGVSNADRSSYRLWKERKVPDFVLEITSRSTYREDQGSKREVYRALGVREYWQYDPTGDYLEPPLQGLELSAGEYRRLPGRELADGTLALASGVLGLELRVTARGLRFHDPDTGQDLPNLAETDEARQAAETRLAQEVAARQQEAAAHQQEAAAHQQEAAAHAAAQARVAELEALLRRERGRESGQDGNPPAPRQGR